MPQQMLVHKGGKIKNWGGECRDVTHTKLQSQNIFKESTGGSGWGGQDGCERRIKLFVKFKKKNIFFFGGGGRVGGGWSGWGQGRCEQRSEVFVKIQKKKNWGGSGWVGGVRVDVIEELKFSGKFKQNKFRGGGGGGGRFGGGGRGSGWGARVDVNQELIFFL